jgi:DNA ligase 1
MRLLDVAEAAERLEATSSRRTMVEVVADLLARAADEDREPLVFLLQAKLRPPYEGVELGLGPKLLIQAIGRAYDTSASNVAERNKKLGDLGLVAEALAPKADGRARGGGPSVRDVYDSLLAIARVSGSGSVERKTAMLADLLQRLASGNEAKFVIRTAQGRLRLGVGDQTILDAAAHAALGDARKKPVLEHAYNVRSDLGAVVRLAFAKGARGLEAIGPQVGVPIRPALAQRLPSARAIIDRLGEVQAEPKYDGFRLQLHRDGQTAWAFSRRLENVTVMFPDLVASFLSQLRSSRVIIEGEAVGYNAKTGKILPFQDTMTSKRKKQTTEGRDSLRLFAFDVLYVGRENFMPRPQRERSERLSELVAAKPGGAVAVNETHFTSDPRDLDRYFNQMIARGLEGIVAKKPDAPYQAGSRGYDWVKLKRSYQSHLRDTIDVVIVGYLRGRGKRTALGIGSLLGAVYDPGRDRFRTVAKVGAGLTETAWRDLRAQLDRGATSKKPANVDSLVTPDVWVEPRTVVEVLADEVTRSPFHTAGKTGSEPGYALRFPRVLSVRTDKGAADATTEKEVMDLYRMQREGGKRTTRAKPSSGRRRAIT